MIVVIIDDDGGVDVKGRTCGEWDCAIERKNENTVEWNKSTEERNKSTEKYRGEEQKEWRQYGVLYGRIVQRWIRPVILRELFLLSCVHLFLSLLSCKVVCCDFLLKIGHANKLLSKERGQKTRRITEYMGVGSTETPKSDYVIYGWPLLVERNSGRWGNLVALWCGAQIQKYKYTKIYKCR